jgi:hypothetical protein
MMKHVATLAGSLVLVFVLSPTTVYAVDVDIKPDKELLARLDRALEEIKQLRQTIAEFDPIGVKETQKRLTEAEKKLATAEVELSVLRGQLAEKNRDDFDAMAGAWHYAKNVCSVTVVDKTKGLLELQFPACSRQFPGQVRKATYNASGCVITILDDNGRPVERWIFVRKAQQIRSVNEETTFWSR